MITWRNGSGYRVARCGVCRRVVRVVNLQQGRDGVMVGPCCLRRQLADESTQRAVESWPSST